ncbi:MAG: MFS transporter [Dongiaceae bacterium]
MATQRSLTILAGAGVINVCFGTLHAFSVLLVPWEQTLQAARGSISLIYSTAILSITVAVLLSHRLFERVAHAPLALSLGFVAAAGLTIAALATNVAVAMVGFGAIFGLADGIGYALAIERAAASWPARKGLAIGVVTAAYATGAMAGAPLLAEAAAQGGIRAALLLLAGIVLCACAIAAALFQAGGGSRAPSSSLPPPPIFDRALLLLWLSYLTGATAGLMAIGHAAGIMVAHGGRAGQAAVGATVIALGNGVGSLLGGCLTDRWAPRRVLTATALLSAASVLLLAVELPLAGALAALAGVGFAYGALITIYPIAATILFGQAAGSRAFGRIFTAWGIAGLAGPWLAGYLFDLTRGYGIALAVAAAAAMLCAGLAVALPKEVAQY